MSVYCFLFNIRYHVHDDRDTLFDVRSFGNPVFRNATCLKAPGCHEVPSHIQRRDRETHRYQHSEKETVRGFQIGSGRN